MLAAVLLFATIPFAPFAEAEYRKCGNVYVWFPIDIYGHPQVPAAAAGAYDPNADQPYGAFKGISPCKCAEHLRLAAYTVRETPATRGGTTEEEFRNVLRYCPDRAKGLLEERYQITKELRELSKVPRRRSKDRETEDPADVRANELNRKIEQVSIQIGKVLAEVCDSVSSPDYRDKLLPYNPNWDKKYLTGNASETAQPETPSEPPQDKTPFFPTGAVFEGGGIPGSPRFRTPAPTKDPFQVTAQENAKWHCLDISWATWQDRLSAAGLAGVERFLSLVPAGTDVMIHATISEDGSVGDVTPSTLNADAMPGAGQMIAAQVYTNLTKARGQLQFPEYQLRTQRRDLPLRHSVSYELHWQKLHDGKWQEKIPQRRNLDEHIEFPPGVPAPANARDCPNHPTTTMPPLAPTIPTTPTIPTPATTPYRRPFTNSSGPLTIPGTTPGLYQKRFGK